MTTYFAHASVTISPDLIGHVKYLYDVANEKIAHTNMQQNGSATSNSTNPQRTTLAIPAYILATAAVEAFINEVFLSDMAQLGFTGQHESRPSLNWHRRIYGWFSQFRADPEKPLEQLDLETKLIEVPLRVVGQSLIRGQQPHQDMQLLIKLRNELIHYKMGAQPPRPVRVLAQHGIAFSVPPDQEGGGPHTWPDRVSTLEGIKWAHNTVCATAIGLIDLIPEAQRTPMEFYRQNFEKIP